jgi:hypothetical protein
MCLTFLSDKGGCIDVAKNIYVHVITTCYVRSELFAPQLNVRDICCHVYHFLMRVAIYRITGQNCRCRRHLGRRRPRNERVGNKLVAHVPRVSRRRQLTHPPGAGDATK